MIKKPIQNNRKKIAASSSFPKPKSTKKDVAKPFIEHVHELRVRLMWVTLSLGIASVVGYVIHDRLLAIVRKPLGQTLYYTSPVGGLNFLMKLCLTFGIIVALPVIMYNILRFFYPLLERVHKTAIARYLICSIVLAYGGVVFAYFVSLPAALHFLATFGNKEITSLITADEYYSFALAYLTGFALLFQLPIVILFINRIKPLKPSKMMKFQRYIILASFIVAAVLTPTPDPINQTIMALPAVLLYQVSLIMVWRINKKRGIGSYETAPAIPDDIVAAVDEEPRQQQPVIPPKIEEAPTEAPIPVMSKQPITYRPMMSDIRRPQSSRIVTRPTPAPRTPTARPFRAMDVFAG